MTKDRLYNPNNPSILTYKTSSYISMGVGGAQPEESLKAVPDKREKNPGHWAL